LAGAANLILGSPLVAILAACIRTDYNKKSNVNHASRSVMHKHFLPSVLLMSLCLGCGTGEYESRIGQHRGGGAAGGDELLGPAEQLAGTRISIRPPTCMTLMPPGADSKRSKVPALSLPGLQMRVYEGFVKDSDGGDIPFYCVVMAMDVPKGMNMGSQVQAMASAQPGKPQVTEVQVTGPDGKDNKWQTAHGGGKDEFYYKGKDGKEAPRPMDAVAEMYAREDAGTFIMMAWRVPANIQQNVGNVGLSELAKAAAGGVSVKPQ
jgi:hypothetical protein